MRPGPIQIKHLAIAAAVLCLPAIVSACPWLITSAFSTTYLPHGFCFLWNPRLLWLHVLSDAVIFLSYTAIASMLGRLVFIARRTAPTPWVLAAFGVFIIACGFTHLLEIVTLWKPLYWFSGDVKLITAFASLATAAALPIFIPEARIMLGQASLSAVNEQRFLAATDSSLDCFYIFESVRDAAGEIIDFRAVFLNANAARLIDREREDLLGVPLRRVIPISQAADALEIYKQVVQTGTPLVDDCRIEAEGVNASWLRRQVIKVGDGIAVTTSNISESKQNEAELVRAWSFAQSAIDNSPAAIIVTNLEGTIQAVNPAAVKMLWYSADELVGKTTPAIFYDRQELEDNARLFAPEIRNLNADHPAFSAGVGNGRIQEAEWTYIRKNGSRFSANVIVSSLQDGTGAETGYLITASDITERKRREEYISHLAQHDALTGLPTRQLLMDRLAVMLARSERYMTRSALLMIDLNNFKQVNDNFGHHIGDLLLVQVAERLRAAVRAMDTVARMGGDEFVMLIADLDAATDAERIAEKLLAVFHPPFILNEQNRIEMSASIGVCVYPDGGADASALIRNADLAMYHAKASGKNCYQAYTQGIAELALQQRDTETALRDALDAQEFRLYYQPQFSLADGRMVGVEALIRWHSKRLGMVEPSRFIPLAEQSGLILPIGAWVLRTACAQLRRLQLHFGPQLIMAVNLSARQLDQPDLLAVVEAAIAENSLDPTSLEIEITETMLMSDSPKASLFFDGLRKLGVRVAIDDFGTGFSSMSYLLRFSVDRLKIDRCFIKDCSTNPNSATVTSAIIALAHQLSLSVVAEGVENQQQMDFLKSAGCDDVQGFHLCRPVPPELISHETIA